MSVVVVVGVPIVTIVDIVSVVSAWTDEQAHSAFR